MNDNGGQQNGSAMRGLAVPNPVPPPTPETPPPPASSPEELLAFVLGKVGALEKECMRLSRDLNWTQQELDRVGKEFEADLEGIKTKHQEEMDLLQRTGRGGSDERKGADPPSFNGNQKELEGWITSCRMAFANQPSKFGTERKKVLWAASFLTGLPLQAFQPILNRYLSGGEETVEVASFEGLATALRGLYGDPNLEQNAKTAIHFLKQAGGSVTAYYAKFVSHSQHTGLGDEALGDYFYRGLNDSIKDELAKMGPWKGLYQLKMRATQLDSRLRERRAEREFEAKAASNANERKSETHPSKYGFQPAAAQPDGTDSLPGPGSGDPVFEASPDSPTTGHLVDEPTSGRNDAHGARRPDPRRVILRRMSPTRFVL